MRLQSLPVAAHRSVACIHTNTFARRPLRPLPAFPQPFSRLQLPPALSARPCHGAGARQRRTHVCIHATARSLSLNQRWRALKFGLKDAASQAQRQILSWPLTQQALHLLQLFNSKLGPLYRVLDAVRWLLAQIGESYEEFVNEETKRQWRWKRKTEKELKFWIDVKNFVLVLLMTMFWETIVPVSFFLALVIPVWAAWAVYDDRPIFLLSPVGLGLLIMLPLKFTLFGPFKWLI
ncbi:hypothetical protein WJX72_008561 [[Myrmecia] bisecta]|uniref:Uncharacterized protein n=1 Tax=[Myrmecia] bisecta TaxID=41462 RepID=A0AAW1QSH2_9CHLO